MLSLPKTVVLLVILGLTELSGAAKVSDAPKLIGLLDELNSPEGTNATITCSLGSGQLQGLTYEWVKNKGERVQPVANKIKIDIIENYQSMLRIINLKPEDSALYTCIAKNRFGQDKISTKLNVQVQLKWTSQPKDVEISAGRSLNVPCSSEGNPPPNVVWSKLDTKAGKEVLEVVLKRVNISELRFDSIQTSDSGLYICRASNGLDDDLVAKIRVDVRGKYR